jgi:hypothetical protein
MRIDTAAIAPTGIRTRQDIQNIRSRRTSKFHVSPSGVDQQLVGFPPKLESGWFFRCRAVSSADEHCFFNLSVSNSFAVDFLQVTGNPQTVEVTGKLPDIVMRARVVGGQIGSGELTVPIGHVDRS